MDGYEALSPHGKGHQNYKYSTFGSSAAPSDVALSITEIYTTSQPGLSVQVRDSEGRINDDLPRFCENCKKLFKPSENAPVCRFHPGRFTQSFQVFLTEGKRWTCCKSDVANAEGCIVMRHQENLRTTEILSNFNINLSGTGSPEAKAPPPRPRSHSKGKTEKTDDDDDEDTGGGLFDKLGNRLLYDRSTPAVSVRSHSRHLQDSGEDDANNFLAHSPKLSPLRSDGSSRPQELEFYKASSGSSDRLHDTLLLATSASGDGRRAQTPSRTATTASSSSSSSSSSAGGGASTAQPASQRRQSSGGGGSSSSNSTVAPRTADLRYEVQKSDTLQGIALRYGLKVADLMRANKMMNPNNLSLRQFIIIPSQSVDVRMNELFKEPWEPGD